MKACSILLICFLFMGEAPAQDRYIIQVMGTVMTIQYEKTYYPSRYTMRVVLSDVTEGKGINLYHNRKKQLLKYVNESEMGLLKTETSRSAAWRRGIFGKYFGRERSTLYHIQSSCVNEVVELIDFVQNLGVKSFCFSDIIYPDTNDIKRELREGIVAQASQSYIEEKCLEAIEKLRKYDLIYKALLPHKAYYVPGLGRTQTSNYYIEGIKVGGGGKVVEEARWNKTVNIEELAETSVAEWKIKCTDN